MIDLIDRKLINALQKELPLVHSPFEGLAKELEISAEEIVERIHKLKELSYWTRFGPLFNIERFGGVFLLAAIEVPEDRFDQVNEVVNSFSEVAHNYKRSHKLNMWFVLAVEKKEELLKICTKIEKATDLKVYPMPKLKEYYVNLFFDALKGSGL